MDSFLASSYEIRAKLSNLFQINVNLKLFAVFSDPTLNYATTEAKIVFTCILM